MARERFISEDERGSIFGLGCFPRHAVFWRDKSVMRSIRFLILTLVLFAAPLAAQQRPLPESTHASTSSTNAAVTSTPPPPPVSVSIAPTSASVLVGQSQQFTAAVSGTTNAAVNWLVSGIRGGNSTVGTISSSGLYAAPQSVPKSSVTVTAQSAVDHSASASAAITITPGSSFVPEFLETAFIYVDAKTGNDSNPGTQAQPFKTLQAAARLASTNNSNNIGSRITINSGIYREKVLYDGAGPTKSAPVTFQAAIDGTVTIAGSGIWSGWTASGNLFTHSFPSIGGPCPMPSGWPSMPAIVFRREMIFVNGTPLTQVLSFQELVVGTFYIDDTNSVAWIWPPAGTQMSTALVEVAQRSNAFAVFGAENIVLRGMTFEHAATCPSFGQGLVISDSDHILIDNDKFVWNNSSGLGFSSVSNVVVQNSAAYHNGGSGFAADQGKKFRYLNDETSYNNWRQAQGAQYGWAYDGAKLLKLHTADVNGFRAYYNQTGGIWFDTDNANVTIENLDSSNNLTHGMFLEASEGPVTITNSKFCNNKDNDASSITYGALVAGNADNVTLSGTLLYNNAVPFRGGQIKIGGTGTGRPVTNWETGQAYNVQSQHWTLSGNTIVGIGSNEDLFFFSLNPIFWTLFQASFLSDNNTWWNASNANVFHPAGGMYTLQGWNSLTGQDAHSTFADPRISCAPPTPDYPDYWLTTYFKGDTQTVTHGASTSYTIQVFPVGAFTGTVNLTVDGATQIGAPWILGSSSIIGGAGSTVLTVNTSAGTSIGTFPITVIATSGSVTRTLTLTLTVQ